MRMRLLRDERVAELVTAGNPEAFAILYERYHGPIYRYCLAILRDPDDARDALQTTMLNAFRSLADRSDGLTVRPWLYRIAHNAAVSLARQRRAHVELTDELSGGRLPADELHERTLAGEILEQLAELPARRRGALVLRELQGLRYEEIGIALDMTPGAARQAVFEARVALSELRAGGELDCQQACERISTRDGRRLRSRALRAHLRTCESCRRFGRLVHARRRGLAALPALAAGMQIRILDGILQAGSSQTVATVATMGAKAGGFAPLLKGAATGVAVLAIGFGGFMIERGQGDGGPSPTREATPASVPRSSFEPRGGTFGTPAVVELASEAPPVERKSKERKKRAPHEEAAVLASVQSASSANEAAAEGEQAAPFAGSSAPSSQASGSSSQGRSAEPSQGSGQPPPSSGGGSGGSGSGGGSQAAGPPAGGNDASPGQGGTPPGQGGTPPGQGGTPPGQGGTPPGPGGSPPGQGGTPPGQGGTPPGQVDPPPDGGQPAPGSGGSPRADAGTPPGQGGTPPGHGGTPPGQAGVSSSAAAAAPGHGGTPPGQGGTPPGQAKPK
jgi:RNA polymerase sigma factor (sigma-70 family)